MKASLSNTDRTIVSILAVIRGARVEDMAKFLRLRATASVEALRKRMSRLVTAGYLATSKIANGKLLYRLSHKGTRITDAPPAFAASPSGSIAAEMISKAAFGWKDDFIFPTKGELQAFFRDIVQAAEEPKLMGTFVFRSANASRETNGARPETSLHFWLCEPRPAEEIFKRAETILAKLLSYACFRDLAEAKLLGFTIVVPTAEAKNRLAEKSLGIPILIEVCQELQNLFLTKI